MMSMSMPVSMVVMVVMAVIVVVVVMAVIVVVVVMPVIVVVVVMPVIVVVVVVMMLGTIAESRIKSVNVKNGFGGVMGSSSPERINVGMVRSSIACKSSSTMPRGQRRHSVSRVRVCSVPM